MNRKLVAGLSAVALACSALAQELTYENAAFLSAPPDIPPNIDAFNFVNNGTFIINLTNQIWFQPPFQPPYPFEMQNVRNYTNSGGMFMAFNTGFRVDTFDPAVGVRQPASIFHNEGTIHCGTSDTFSTLNFEGFFGLTNVVFVGSSAGSKFLLSADKVINPGTLEMGFDSLCSLNANDINMDYGVVTMETNGFSAINFGLFQFNALIFDGYWGLSTNPVPPTQFIPANWFEFPPPITPPHVVTNRNYFVDGAHQLGGPTFRAYLSDTTDVSGSNRFVRVVFLSNTNALLQANVYFPIGATVIEWTNTSTALGNNLYLFDSFLYRTNFQLALDGFSGPRPTYIPVNFNFIVLPGGFFFFGAPATPTVIPFGTFDSSNITNQYAAYEALFQPTSVVLSDTFGQTYSNSPGRIEITATNYLTLKNSLLSSLNFLRLGATNQFGGSAGAKISSPYSEFNLRSANGLLAITNLTVPTLNRDEGICDLYSARWTNVVGSVTNNFHVLFVDSKFSPYAPTRVVNLILRSTNVFGGDDNMIISDVLNIVSNNILLECSRLTLTTNGPGASSPEGALNFLNSSVVWSDITPRLQFLTNNGFIDAPSTMFFRGSRKSPYYSGTFNERYDYFLNRGGVTNFSSRIYAEGFQNSGTFFGSGGAIELHECGSALLTNAAFVATGFGGLVTIESGNLLASNYVIQAGAAITLNITNLLDDGSISANSADYVSNKNFWISGNGVNMLHLPANGSLLATTVSNTAPLSRFVPITWAGADKGPTPDGFANNAAIGRLILDGDLNSAYVFRAASGTNGSNAIYIDQLELRDFTATNVDSLGNFLSLSCDPNMKVYFGQALADGRSVAEKLPLVNSGSFVWVSNYNTGFFSSTNVIYPDGSTNRLNTALVTSCDIDSNGNGIPNCMDPAPIPVLTASGLALSVTYTNLPSAAAVVSWTAFPFTANSLYFASSANSTNWELVTNFVYQGSLPNRVTVTDLVKTNAPRFYRVRAGSP